jgi:hypothetical protein
VLNHPVWSGPPGAQPEDIFVNLFREVFGFEKASMLVRKLTEPWG